MQKSKKNTRKNVKRISKKSRRLQTQAVSFEVLETRQLMSTVNVASFGATPNGGDDTSAIMAAVNASKPGDTILFSGGIFNIGGSITVPGDRTYLGQNGGGLQGADGHGVLMHLTGDGATIKGLTFNGGGLFIDGGGGDFRYNNNLLIDNNTFNLNAGGDDNNCITATGGLENTKITNNYMTGYNGQFGIYGYNYKGLTISNNQFVNLVAGMHIDAFGNSGNLLVEQNYMTGLKGMGMEFQGTSTHDIFQDNWYEHPSLSSNFPVNNNSFAYSLILAKSSDIQILRNVVIAPERPDGTGCRIGFEVGGDNTIVQDNYINGVNNALAANDGDGTSSVTIGNNYFVNYIGNAKGWLGGIRMNAVTILPGTRQDGNAAINPLVLARVAAHNVPQRNIRYGSSGDTVTPTDPTPNDPTPSGTAPAAATGLAGFVTGATSANLFWTDMAIDETSYTIQNSTDGGKTWKTVGTIAANSHGYQVSGLAAGTTYSFRVNAVNANGATASNVISLTPKAFDASVGTYVSDMAWSNITNGWGPAERDMSNGEKAQGDGSLISIAGKTYAKGAGVHANSEIDLALGGKYSSFVSDVGIDDETNGNGTVEFQVWGDGKKLYDSGLMTAVTGIKNVNVSVAGVQKLQLIVLPGADGVDYDHADWAGARLTTSSVTPPVKQPVDPDPTPNTTTYLSDMDYDTVANGWGPVEKDASNGEQKTGDGHTLTLNGVKYTKGLGVHAPSNVQYQLGGNFATFSADIGLDDEVGNNGAVDFQVWADGVELYDSGTMTGASLTKSININVQGRQELTLIVGVVGNVKNYDHADWANARLLSAPTSTQFVSDMLPVSQTNGWGPVEQDTSVGDKAGGDGAAITLNGVVYSKGLGVHSDSKVVYNLGGAFTTFTTDMGVDDEVGNNGSVDFQIWADGVELYDSGTMTGSSATKTATVNVAGKNQLWLVVTNAGDGYDFDHADWANPRLAAA